MTEEKNLKSPTTLRLTPFLESEIQRYANEFPGTYSRNGETGTVSQFIRTAIMKEIIFCRNGGRK